MSIKANPLSVLLIVALAASCGPSAPTSFPRTSAASELAEEAPQAPIGAALREDPNAGWVGLGGGDAGSSVAPMHHHMPGMDMSGMDGGHDAH